MTILPLSRRQEAEVCARMMASSEPWVTLGRGYEGSLALVEDTSKEVYVAYGIPGPDDAGEEGDPTGFLVLDMNGPFVGYIQSVCVRPDQRGRGLGSAMVRWAEDRIFASSPNVFLCVSSFNPRARDLYARLGYQVIGELTDYLVPGHSEILMRKTIGPLSTRVAP